MADSTRQTEELSDEQLSSSPATERIWEEGPNPSLRQMAVGPDGKEHEYWPNRDPIFDQEERPLR